VSEPTAGCSVATAPGTFTVGPLSLILIASYIFTSLFETLGATLDKAASK
jgi:hypothetical protein